MELYKNRHKNPEALQQWQQIEEELFKNNKDLVMKNEIVENADNPDKQTITLPNNIQANNEHLPLKNVRLIRQPSSDEGCYTSSSNTCSSSSSGEIFFFIFCQFMAIFYYYSKNRYVPNKN